MRSLYQEMPRAQAEELMRIRGSKKRPQAPRELLATGGGRSVLLTWKLPVDYADIIGWRVYSPSEGTLIGSIQDRGTRQFTVAASSGASPTSAAYFVSAISRQGLESQKVQVIGSATAEAGAPAPPTPPASSGEGGKDSGGGGIIDPPQDLIFDFNGRAEN